MKKRFLLPLLILLTVIVLAYIAGIHHLLTLENLRRVERDLVTYAQSHPVLTPFLYIGFYILSVCLVIPDSTLLTLLGGLIFPLPMAVLFAVVSETVGATLFFAIFRTAFGDKYVAKKGFPFLGEIKKTSASYLLFLRISHISPFWLTNVAAAFFRVPYKTFVWTTAVGVIPLTFIVADIGHNLTSFFNAGEKLLTSQMKLALLGLGLIALIPVIIRLIQKWRKKP